MLVGPNRPFFFSGIPVTQGHTASQIPIASVFLASRQQIHAVVATVEAGFLVGIPKTMVADIAPSLKSLDNAVMKHPKVRHTY